MPFPELMVEPIRRELTQHGFEELRTPDDVDALLKDGRGTVLIAVNSTCGCAATRMRPAVIEALRNAQQKPDRITTVFAGQDLDATARVREYITGYPPSSPSVALMKDGKVAFMLERKDIERRTPPEIAADLVRALDSLG